eukprot:snap_masked-scaffold_13-processed-gene-10.56-mRNA-1 protein AED:1.00 eAED:1.00 QI:0/0/0/0/1/1/2/0/358
MNKKEDKNADLDCKGGMRSKHSVRIKEMSVEEKRVYNAEASRKHRTKSKRLYSEEEDSFTEMVAENLELKFNQRRHVYEINLIKQNEYLRNQILRYRESCCISKTILKCKLYFPSLNGRSFFSNIKQELQRVIDLSCSVSITKQGLIYFDNKRFRSVSNRIQHRKKINQKIESLLSSETKFHITSFFADKELKHILHYSCATRNLDLTNITEIVWNYERFLRKGKNLSKFKPCSKKIAELSSHQARLWQVHSYQDGHLPLQKLKFTIKRTDQGKPILGVKWLVSASEYTIVNIVHLRFNENKHCFQVDEENFVQVKLVKSWSSSNSLRVDYLSTANPQHRLTDVERGVEELALIMNNE